MDICGNKEYFYIQCVTVIFTDCTKAYVIKVILEPKLDSNGVSIWPGMM